MKKIICFPLAFIMWGCPTQNQAVNPINSHVHNWTFDRKENDGSIYIFYWKCMNIDPLTSKQCTASKRTFTPYPNDF